ncbi:N terminus of Rad21 / Rec8 like family protein [Acanthocheilonema viteae]
MFFIPSLLMKRNEPLAVIWRVVFDEKWRPSRKIILDINVQRVCELLIGKIPNGNPGEIKFSLYLLAQLSYGIALIVQKRGDILCRDMETFIPIIRRYQDEDENESSMKGKKDRKKRAAKRNDLLILDSSFETIENEHLKFVLDYSAITLREDIPLPEIDILFNDDFGPLTAAEALQMEALLKEDSEHIIESKSGSTNGSKECMVNIVPETLANNRDVDKTTHVFEMMEVSDEGEICKERQYDLGSDETLRESEIKHPTSLSILELSEVHDSQMLVPKKKRRKHGTIIDEITMFSKVQLQAQIDNSNDLLHIRDEVIPQISKHRMVTVQDLFDAYPVTLREFSKNPASNLDAWIAAPEYDEPPLQYEEAMQLEPMQPPPMRILHHSLVGKETSIEPTSHGSVTIEQQDLERQSVTPLMENIEQERRNTTSTAPFSSIHITDPSSQLRSDGGLPIAFSESQQFDEKMKISVATIFERITKENGLQERIDDSFILSAEKARVTELFSNLGVESELYGTRLESSTENVLVDEKYSEYEIRQEDPQNEVNVRKISVMQDRFQLKINKVESAVKTSDSSVPVYHQTQKAHELFGLITEFLNFYKISKLCFSELVRGRSAVFAARAFTNLLELLSKQKVKVEQKENFAEIIISLSILLLLDSDLSTKYLDESSDQWFAVATSFRQ